MITGKAVTDIIPQPQKGIHSLYRESSIITGTAGGINPFNNTYIHSQNMPTLFVRFKAIYTTSKQMPQVLYMLA
jgi:hypothetical protein